MLRLFDNNGRFDLHLRGYAPHEAAITAAVEQGHATEFREIESAVILSLWTDRTAPEGRDVPDTTDHRGGWWAMPEAGSLLWLYRRASASTPGILDRLSEDAREALLWMEDSGLAAPDSVTARAERNPAQPTRIDLAVSLTRAQDRREYDRRFSLFWSGA